MLAIFIAGALFGAGLLALFENSVWMQTRRVAYDLDRDGRERLAEIKEKERLAIDKSRASYGLSPIRRIPC